MLPKRSDTQFFWAQLSKTLLFIVIMSIIISNCTSFFVRLSKSGKIASVHWQPAGGGGNRDWQLHPAGHTYCTFFFHFNLRLCVWQFRKFAPYVMSNSFILQIMSLRIFSITFVHMSAYMYFVGLCFMHTDRQVNIQDEAQSFLLSSYPPPPSSETVSKAPSLPSFSVFQTLSILYWTCSHVWEWAGLDPY